MRSDGKCNTMWYASCLYSMQEKINFPSIEGRCWRQATCSLMSWTRPMTLRGIYVVTMLGTPVNDADSIPVSLAAGNYVALPFDPKTSSVRINSNSDIEEYRAGERTWRAFESSKKRKNAVNQKARRLHWKSTRRRRKETDKRNWWAKTHLKGHHGG